MAPLLRGPRQTGRLLGASATAVYVDFDTNSVPRVLALLPPTSVRLPLGMVVAGTLPPIAGDPAVVVGELSHQGRQRPPVLAATHGTLAEC